MYTALEMIYALGLFFGGIIGLSQYSSTYSADEICNRKVSRSKLMTFLKGIGTTCLVSDGGRIVAFSSGTMLSSGLLDYKLAIFAVFGAVVASSSSSFFVIFDSHSLVYCLIGFGGIIYFTFRKKNNKLKRISIFCFYLGILLLGMLDMKSAFAFLKNNQAIHHYLANESGLFLFIIYGAVLSIILQSGGAVTFLVIALFRANLVNYDQSFLFLIGSCMGSSVRGQLYAFAFSGRAKQLISLFANIKIIGFILLLIFFIVFYFSIGSFEILRNVKVFDNLAFDYAVSATISNILSVFLLIPFIKQIEKFYNKLMPVDELEIRTQAHFIKNISLMPKKDWPELLENEKDHVLRCYSESFIDMISRRKEEYLNYYNSKKTIIRAIDNYSRDYFQSENQLPFSEANYELLILLKKLNYCIFSFFDIYKTVSKHLDPNIRDSVIEHIHLLLSELGETSKKSEKEMINMFLSTLNDDNYRKRRRQLYRHLICKGIHNENIPMIAFINAYTDITITVKMMLECFLCDDNEIESK